MNKHATLALLDESCIYKLFFISAIFKYSFYFLRGPEIEDLAYNAIKKEAGPTL